MIILIHFLEEVRIIFHTNLNPIGPLPGFAYTLNTLVFIKLDTVP